MSIWSFMMLHEALVVSVEPSRWSSLFNKGLKAHWTAIYWVFLFKPRAPSRGVKKYNPCFMKLHLPITTCHYFQPFVEQRAPSRGFNKYNWCFMRLHMDFTNICIRDILASHLYSGRKRRRTVHLLHSQHSEPWTSGAPWRCGAPCEGPVLVSGFYFKCVFHIPVGKLRQ